MQTKRVVLIKIWWKQEKYRKANSFCWSYWFYIVTVHIPLFSFIESHLVLWPYNSFFSTIPWRNKKIDLLPFNIYKVNHYIGQFRNHTGSNERTELLLLIKILLYNLSCSKNSTRSFQSYQRTRYKLIFQKSKKNILDILVSEDNNICVLFIL